MIGNRLLFREHLTCIGGKCAATTCALAQIITDLKREETTTDEGSDITFTAHGYGEEDLQSWNRSSLQKIHSQCGFDLPHGII